MGTRGAITFVIDGVEKTAYNHSDSYPSGLGANILNALRPVVTVEEEEYLPLLREGVRNLRVVEPGSKPTAEDIERLVGFADISVSTRSLDDWYVLLRNTQGDIAAMIRAGVIEDATDFPLDSLMCEWAYVLDLDTLRFEVYEGFQTVLHSYGRFADRFEPKGHREEMSQYYPVRLVASWPLSALATLDPAEFERRAEGVTPDDAEGESYEAYQDRRNSRVPYIADAPVAVTASRTDQPTPELEAAPDPRAATLAKLRQEFVFVARGIELGDVEDDDFVLQVSRDIRTALAELED